MIDRPTAIGGRGLGMNGGHLLSLSVSTPIDVDVELEGDATPEKPGALLDEVDRVAEIPNSPRRGTEVRLRERRITGI